MIYIYILQTIIGTIYWFKAMKNSFDGEPKYNPLILIGSFVASLTVFANVFLILFYHENKRL